MRQPRYQVHVNHKPMSVGETVPHCHSLCGLGVQVPGREGRSHSYPKHAARFPSLQITSFVLRKLPGAARSWISSVIKAIFSFNNMVYLSSEAAFRRGPVCLQHPPPIMRLMRPIWLILWSIHQEYLHLNTRCICSHSPLSHLAQTHPFLCFSVCFLHEHRKPPLCFPSLNTDSG